MRSVVVAYLFILNGIIAASQVTFQKPIIFELYGCKPTSVLELPDAYLIASFGYSAYSGTLGYRSAIVFHKVDLHGNLIWEKVFSEAGKARIIGEYGSLFATDNGYLLGGDETDTSSNDQYFFLARFDTSVDLQWIKKYPKPGKQNCYSGSLTKEGGYIMIGETFFSQAPADYYLAKTDSSGNIEWEKTYGGSSYDIGRIVKPLPGGGYVVSGESKSFGLGGFDLWFFKTDSLGSKTWEKVFGTVGNDRLRYIYPSASGGYIAWGRLDTVVYNTETQFAPTVMKFDENGEIEWRTFFNHKRLGIFWQLKELGDGSIVAIGEQWVGQYVDSTAAWITKLNSSGDILWERIYIGPVNLEDTLFDTSTSFNGDFQQTTDGGFIIAGQTWKSTQQFPNIFHGHPWIVKLDSNGCLGPEDCGVADNVNEIQPSKELAQIAVYPNPLTANAVISIKARTVEDTDKRITCRLFDSSGRLLQSMSSMLNQYGYCEFSIFGCQYSPGTYLYKIIGEVGELGDGSFIVQ